MQRNALVLLAAAALFSPCTVAADPPLFASHELLEIELSGDIHSVIRDTEDRERRKLELRTGDRVLEVEARVRGKSRAAVCEFPPLKIFFGDAGDTVFEGQKSLKLITHCYNSAGGDRYMRKEYAAFRIFRALTDKGYDARLARIRYNDADGRLPKRASERLGVFIESDDGLASRFGGEMHESLTFRRSELDVSHAALVYVFEYLIGNNDWATTHTFDDDQCCHNLDIMRVDGKLFLIPFDFDLSRFVDASYADNRPGAQLIREPKRKNKIHCVGEEPLGAAVQHVIASRAQIEAEIAAVPLANESDIRGMTRDIERFYRLAEKEGRIPRAIDTRCL